MNARSAASRQASHEKSPGRDTLPRPTAQRLQRPSWRDARLVVGVLLLALATVGGAVLFDRMDDSVQVYRAKANLVPGQPVTADDVESVRVRMDGVDRQYLKAGKVPSGRVLREVAAGELVPAAAIGSPSKAGVKAVSVAIDPSLAATLVRGSTVDVWVSAKKDQSAGTAYETPKRMVQRAVVSRVPREDGGGLGVATGQSSSVHVLVPDDRVDEVIGAVNSESKVTLVATADSPLRASS